MSSVARSAPLLAMALCLAAASPAPQEAQAGSSSFPVVPLQVAEGDFGAARSAKGLLLASGAKGRELYLFDKGTGQVTGYLESGAVWMEAVTLRDERGEPFRSPCFRMDVDSGLAAFSCVDRVALFKSDGTLVGQSQSYFLTTDVAALPGGDWAFSLLQVPEGNGRFLGTKERGPAAPRLVALNRKLEVVRRGLPVGAEERSTNQAAARALILAAAGQQVFAAEVANYKVYQMDRRLKLRASFWEPELQLEEGRARTPAAVRRDDKLQQAVAGSLTGRRSNAAAPPDERPAVEGGALNYLPVVEDIAWDPVSGRLALLLSGHGTRSRRPILDFFDPVTEHVERFILRLPESLPQEVEISQLSIGRRFLWLRAHKGDSPTLRLDRLDLELAPAGTPLRLKTAD